MKDEKQPKNVNIAKTWVPIEQTMQDVHMK
jgi:hypothetical protein